MFFFAAVRVSRAAVFLWKQIMTKVFILSVKEKADEINSSAWPVADGRQCLKLL
jgi:hypothetical protein